MYLHVFRKGVIDSIIGCRTELMQAYDFMKVWHEVSRKLMEMVWRKQWLLVREERFLHGMKLDVDVGIWNFRSVNFGQLVDQ